MPVELLTSKSIARGPGVAGANADAVVPTSPGTPSAGASAPETSSPYRLNRAHKALDAEMGGISANGGKARARGRSLLGGGADEQAAARSSPAAPGAALSPQEPKTSAPSGSGFASAAKVPFMHGSTAHGAQDNAHAPDGKPGAAAATASQPQGKPAVTEGADGDEPAPAAAPKPAGKAMLDMHIDHVAYLVLALLVLLPLALCWFLLPRWLMAPPLATLSRVLAIGVGIGLAFSYIYFDNTREKAHACQMLGINVGVKGLHHLTGHMPSWLSYTETEKIEWMNQLLEELWPNFDTAVCNQIRTIAEEQLRQTLKAFPSPIESITFKKLTFGEAPFRVESICVNKDGPTDGLDMELDVRWCGDANITLDISVTSPAGPVSICPQVSDISFAGKLRVRLGPLVDVIPGFAAVMVAFVRPPRMKYHMNFGALGGSYAAGVVKPIIKGIINQALLDNVVWPARVLTPMWLPGPPDPEVEKRINKMRHRHRGLLKVEVVRAEELVGADLTGKSDPMVELMTDGKYVSRSKFQRQTLNPQWNQSFWHLVQSPRTQELRVTVLDWDMISASDIIGRCLIKLRAVTEMESDDSDEPGQLTMWFHLGDGEFEDAGGCGKGFGRILLNLTYRTLHKMPRNVLAGSPNDCLGIVVVRVVKCTGLAKTRRQIRAQVAIKVDGVEQVTPAVAAAAGQDHVYNYKNLFEWYEIEGLTGDVKLTVKELLGVQEDIIGFFEQPIAEVADACDEDPLTGRRQPGLMAKFVELEECEGAKIHFAVHYIPCL